MHDNKDLLQSLQNTMTNIDFSFYFPAEEYGFQLRTYIKQHLYSMHITCNEMKLLLCCYDLLAPRVLITTYKIASTKPTYFENQISLHTTETNQNKDYIKVIIGEDIK